MRPAIRIASAAAVSLALLAAGPASAHDRYRHGGGGSQAGVALAVGALVGLAFGAAVASAPVMAAPVTYAPAPVAYAPAPVAYAPPARYDAPAVPPGYCYRSDVGGYVPCAPQARGYYEAPVSYGY